jgi:hypothetical protein
MSKTVEQNDLIALRESVQDLPEGEIGRVLEVLTPEEFEVEFVDDHAHTIAKLRLKLEQVRVLRHEATIDEADLWKLIEEAKAESNGDSDRQVELLVDKVAELSIADIFAFDDIFHAIRQTAYKRDLWSAAYLICGGCSDDGFMDFRAWLIAQGSKVFYAALRDPDILADIVESEEDEIVGISGHAHLEQMNYVAVRSYEKKTDAQWPVFYAIHRHPTEPTGEWDDSYQKMPRLKAKFQPQG